MYDSHSYNVYVTFSLLDQLISSCLLLKLFVEVLKATLSSNTAKQHSQIKNTIFKKKVWKANKKASAGTFLPPGSGLATPDIDDQKNCAKCWAPLPQKYLKTWHSTFKKLTLSKRDRKCLRDATKFFVKLPISLVHYVEMNLKSSNWNMYYIKGTFQIYMVFFSLMSVNYFDGITFVFARGHVYVYVQW